MKMRPYYRVSPASILNQIPGIPSFGKIRCELCNRPLNANLISYTCKGGKMVLRCLEKYFLFPREIEYQEYFLSLQELFSLLKEKAVLKYFIPELDTKEHSKLLIFKHPIFFLHIVF